MIVVNNMEKFVVNVLYKPFCRDFLGDKLPEFPNFEAINRDKEIRKRLRKEPEYIIELLEKYPQTRKAVFERLLRDGGVEWYKYFDKSATIIQWTGKQLEALEESN